MKVATFRNNKKKDWFPHKTELVFVHGHICKGRSRNSATFKMEDFARIGNDRVYNRVYFAVVTQPSLHAKLKFDENGHVLKAASDKTCFYIFSKMSISVSITFCFISKINYKNGNWYHCRFHLQKFY